MNHFLFQEPPPVVDGVSSREDFALRLMPKVVQESISHEHKRIQPGELESEPQSRNTLSFVFV